jgi:hypothetical protein
MKEFPHSAHKPTNNTHSDINIKHDHPWYFFDGATQGDPSLGGEGGRLYLSKSHYISFLARLGLATNKISKLMVLNLLLQLSREREIT